MYVCQSARQSVRQSVCPSVCVCTHVCMSSHMHACTMIVIPTVQTLLSDPQPAPQKFRSCTRSLSKPSTRRTKIPKPEPYSDSFGFKKPEPYSDSSGFKKPEPYSDSFGFKSIETLNPFEQKADAPKHS